MKLCILIKYKFPWQDIYVQFFQTPMKDAPIDFPSSDAFLVVFRIAVVCGNTF